jgi:uncharacterized protein with HEPN domain
MRRDQQRLSDIVEALDWIGKAISGLTEAQFLGDATLCYAIAQKLTIVGEAVARLSPELRRATTLWLGPISWGCGTFSSMSTSVFIGH